MSGRASDVAVDPDGRAIVAGHISADWWVAVYDAEGDLLWEDSEVGPLSQEAKVAMVATEGAYVFTGYDEIDVEPGTTNQRMESWVRQYSIDGSNEWSLQFSHEEYWVAESPITLEEDTDGHRVLVSRRREGPTSFGALRRITARGDLVSSTDVGWDDDDPGFSPSGQAGELVPADPSEVIVVGSFHFERWAVRVDQAGEILWSERWPCVSSCFLGEIAAMPDGNFVILGVVPDPEKEDDPWMASLRGDGKLDWETSWGLPGVRERAHGVTVAPDGTIVVVGGTSVTSTGVQEAWVRKMSPAGDLIWQSTLTPEKDAADVTLSAVATGGDCDGIWVTGSVTDAGKFLALVAP